jgi:hypothetical protein
VLSASALRQQKDREKGPEEKQKFIYLNGAKTLQFFSSVLKGAVNGIGFQRC